MPRSQPTLTYESGVGGALAPDERVLWEAHPTIVPVVPRPRLVLAALFLIPAATASISIIAFDDNFIAIAVVTAGVFLITAIAVGLKGRDQIVANRNAAHVRYRITNRRAVKSDDRRGRATTQTEIVGLTGFSAVRGDAPGITIDAVEFDRTPEADAISVLLLRLWAKSNRRSRVRRTPAAETPDPSPANVPLELPPGIALAPAEKVLWVGRPRASDPVGFPWMLTKLKTFAWLLIPAAMLVWSLGLIDIPKANPVVGVLGGIWLALGLYGATIAKIIEARQRARTWYILTNIRAITHDTGPNGRTHSHLLDMAGYVHIDRRPDGAAQVFIGPACFERLTDPDSLYLVALEAVRVAGTPAGGIIAPYNPDNDA